MIARKTSSRIISFDPGETTGIAFLLDGKFVLGMVALPEMIYFDSFFPSLVKSCSPTEIVVEVPPSSGKFYNKTQYAVYYSICKWFETAGYKVHTISPGQWKHMVDRHQIDSGHIRDAADMAQWFFNREVKMYNG